MPEKENMSTSCGFEYTQRWLDANYYKTTTQEDWLNWYSNHCGKCIHMCEICMFEESIDE